MPGTLVNHLVQCNGDLNQTLMDTNTPASITTIQINDTETTMHDVQEQFRNQPKQPAVMCSQTILSDQCSEDLLNELSRELKDISSSSIHHDNQSHKSVPNGAKTISFYKQLHMDYTKLQQHCKEQQIVINR